MRVVENVLELIGETPMIKLAFSEDDAEIYAKVEYLNPSGSVKDRIARYIIEEAERRGELKPGGTIVEATSGNTGIAFSCAAAAKGYRMVVVMPETASRERRCIMEHYDAEVVLTSAEAFLDGAVSKARELSLQPGWWAPSQFENLDNIMAHKITTGKEILEQIPGGRVDAFIAGIGTGGTLMGVAEVLKKANPDIKIVVADPVGPRSNIETSIPYKCKEHKVEGIGDGFIPAITDVSVIDQVVPVCDEDAIAMARMLARERGLFVGVSSGAFVYAAIKVAKELGRGKVVVTLLPDSADRYYSTDLCKH